MSAAGKGDLELPIFDTGVVEVTHLGKRRDTNIRLLLAVPILALALAGCGAETGGGGVVGANGGTARSTASDPSSAPTGKREAALKFAQCMREHGVDMPDPEPGGPIAIQERKGEERKVQKAQEACKQFMQAAVGEKGQGIDAKERDMLVKLAQCMRQHGIDMLDPGADGRIEINVPAGTPEQKVKDAHEACKQFSADLPLKP
ncbi:MULTISPECIES: hypothetical protein [Streptosporangium]|uniref:Secreted protein n=1 Tax=Streptosporangium brasiliense TaxID=47480 RepID=A0ABT9R1P4_9ACTN|nr:hypothetical protein [Streptosporangium brasiliense]MDP9862821.1 hypothetical protein [Streptosporangium brasiliense]